jgi:uncharacterized protein (TIGR03437 family)
LFQVTARLPFSVEARVIDNCGNPLQNGAASVFFSSGDPAISLSVWPDGVWRGTWLPFNSTSSQVSLKLSAVSTQSLQPAQKFVYGSVTPNPTAPAIQSGSVVNAASSTPNGDTLTIGEIISIYGDLLADAPATAAGGVVGTLLAGTRVSIGNTYLPLLFAQPGQVNAVVPFGINLGPAQLIVERDGAVSAPLPIVVTPAQPGIFTVSAAGQGAILNDSGVVADSTSPTMKGHFIEIYCTGLGGVSPEADVAQPAPSNPLSSLTGISVFVGNVSAEVLWAGLAPGFHGLYQINALVPQAAPSGLAVPVKLNILGNESNVATIAVQ